MKRGGRGGRIRRRCRWRRGKRRRRDRDRMARRIDELPVEGNSSITAEGGCATSAEGGWATSGGGGGDAWATMTADYTADLGALRWILGWYRWRRSITSSLTRIFRARCRRRGLGDGSGGGLRYR